MKVVILCGGMGTRLREETEYRPKPLVKIGPQPILWHIMKIYSEQGFNDFVLCLGYKGEMIKEFFVNFDWMSQDFTLDLKTGKRVPLGQNPPMEDWKITFADTGIQTNTGGRIKRIQNLIEDDVFMCTYGDGLSNVDINALLKFHQNSGKIATLTAIHPMSPFGVIEVEGGLAKTFKEKPQLDGLINGGFFVFSRGIFDYLEDNSVLEEEPLRRLAYDKQLSVYEHKGFWQCMDTFKDVERLNAMYERGERPWMFWENKKGER